jgi:Asp-tRNA(Asn)/Glu-tRNA(Gln) amidotransferase A subunit family amidase
MANDISPLLKMRAEILSGSTSPRDLAERALKNANQNTGRNVYISRDEDWTLREADRVQKEFSAGELSARESSSDQKPPLFGLPV